MTERRPPRPAVGLGLRAVPVGRIAGIPIVVTPWWVLIAVLGTIWFAPYAADQVPGLGQGRYAVGLGFVLLLYGSVLVHEVSHALVARALGLEVKRIALWLLGGVSEISEPRRPDQEFLVAVAGPLVSFILTCAGVGVAMSTSAHTLPGILAGAFAVSNGLIAVFNMLPGLPLDGGRVLRAAMWKLTRDADRGTVVSAWIGRGLAIALLAAALLAPSISVHETGSNGTGRTTSSFIYLFLLAAFIWMGSSQALAGAKFQAVLPRLDVRRLARRALAVSADVSVAEAIRRAREATARALVVVDTSGRPTALVSEAAVTAVPDNRKPWVNIGELSRAISDGLILPVDLRGQDLVAAIQRTPASEYLVVETNGAVFGVLMQSDVVAAVRSS